MKREDLEIPFDIGMLLTRSQQLVVIISNDPKDQRLADIINKNDDYYAFFVKDMDEYNKLAEGFEKHKRSFMPIMIPHQMKQHQKALVDFMELANNLPVNIPLLVSDARAVENLFDTSLLEEMRRGYGGDYMNIQDFDRPESRSAAKSLLPRLRDIPESLEFGKGGYRADIGGDIFDRVSLAGKMILDPARRVEGPAHIGRFSDIHLADFRGHRNLTTECLNGFSYRTIGGDWAYPHRKKGKPPAAAKVRGLNNNGMPSKRGKGRS